MTRVLTEDEAGEVASGTICDSATDKTCYHFSWGMANPALRSGLKRFANAILAKYGSGSPEEKREAERKAAIEALRCHGASELYIEKFLDSYFPHLTPEPPTVTLNGCRYTRENGQWFRHFNVSERESVDMPRCRTSEDFEKCRAIVQAEEQAK